MTFRSYGASAVGLVPHRRTGRGHRQSAWWCRCYGTGSTQARLTGPAHSFSPRTRTCRVRVGPSLDGQEGPRQDRLTFSKWGNLAPIARCDCAGGRAGVGCLNAIRGLTFLEEIGPASGRDPRVDWTSVCTGSLTLGAPGPARGPPRALCHLGWREMLPLFGGHVDEGPRRRGRQMILLDPPFLHTNQRSPTRTPPWPGGRCKGQASLCGSARIGRDARLAVRELASSG